MEKNIDPNFNKKITDQLLDPYNFITARKIIDYRNGDLQTSEYQSTKDDDDDYSEYIIKNYGSLENFYKQKKIVKTARIFDPLTDFIVDVSIVKPDAVYKTDHISSYETIMENLSGVCTVWFVKKDGSTRKLSCTLESSKIPKKENDTRINFFNPLPNNRIGVWDINEQRWKSFYMANVIKFVRDDSTSVE